MLLDIEIKGKVKFREKGKFVSVPELILDFL